MKDFYLVYLFLLTLSLNVYSGEVTMFPSHSPGHSLLKATYNWANSFSSSDVSRKALSWLFTARTLKTLVDDLDKPCVPVAVPKDERAQLGLEDNQFGLLSSLSKYDREFHEELKQAYKSGQFLDISQLNKLMLLDMQEKELKERPEYKDETTKDNKEEFKKTSAFERFNGAGMWVAPGVQASPSGWVVSAGTQQLGRPRVLPSGTANNTANRTGLHPLTIVGAAPARQGSPSPGAGGGATASSSTTNLPQYRHQTTNPPPYGSSNTARAGLYPLITVDAATLAGQGLGSQIDHYPIFQIDPVFKSSPRLRRYLLSEPVHVEGESPNSAEDVFAIVELDTTSHSARQLISQFASEVRWHWSEAAIKIHPVRLKELCSLLKLLSTRSVARVANLKILRGGYLIFQIAQVSESSPEWEPFHSLKPVHVEGESPNSAEDVFAIVELDTTSHSARQLIGQFASEVYWSEALCSIAIKIHPVRLKELCSLLNLFNSTNQPYNNVGTPVQHSPSSGAGGGAVASSTVATGDLPRGRSLFRGRGGSCLGNRQNPLDNESDKAWSTRLLLEKTVPFPANRGGRGRRGA